MKDVDETKLAPIVLFVYNRPSHTLLTLEALAANYLAKDSKLYVFCDGPVNTSVTELDAVRETRRVVESNLWCGEVIIRHRAGNVGLAENIVSGIGEVLETHDRVIVLEDDIVTSKGFLKYMNDSLTFYEKSNNVMHISAYMYPTGNQAVNGTIFLRILSCWGWGTWKRAWKYYSNDLDYFLSKLQSKSAIRRFNIRGHATFYKQLVSNSKGEIRTWAVRWYASWYFKGGYSLFPKTSLIRNIGHDGTGQNSGKKSDYSAGEVAEWIDVKEIPLKEDTKYLRLIDNFYKTAYPRRKKGIMARIFSVLKLWKIKNKIGDWLAETLPDYKYYRSNHSNVRIGKHVKFYQPTALRNVVIGDFSYIGHFCHIQNAQIGKFCSIGPRCLIGWGIHPINGISTAPMFYSKRKQNGMTLSKNDKVREIDTIEIGHDVFIGMNVTILDGVKIGNGAVIGAGAVVSKDIPSYAVAVGNPIKVIKYRFPEEICMKLNDSKWWELDERNLKIVEELFFDVENFLKTIKKIEHD